LDHPQNLKELHTAQHTKNGHLVVVQAAASVFQPALTITHMKCGVKVAVVPQHFAAKAA